MQVTAVPQPAGEAGNATLARFEEPFQLPQQWLQRLQDLCMIFTLTHKLALRPEPLRDPERRPQIHTARHELVQHLQWFTAKASRKTSPRQPQGLAHTIYAQF